MTHNLTAFKQILRHPLFRGMVANSITWPTACLINESLSGKSWGMHSIKFLQIFCAYILYFKYAYNIENYDWKRCGRFFVYGTFVTAPMFYSWIRLSSALWPKTNIQSAIKKVCLEQISYGPMFSVCFFYGMTYMETQDTARCRQEVVDKFWPTYKVRAPILYFKIYSLHLRYVQIAICYWPFVQTINFGLLPERNRVIFVSVASLVFTTFLAYVKQKETLQANRDDQETGSSLQLKVNLESNVTDGQSRHKKDTLL